MVIKKKYLYYFVILVSIVAVNSIIWIKTGDFPWNSVPFNSYSLQAKAWLEGRLDLGMDYPYLELAIYEGKYFVSFPPFPTFIVLPFVKMFNSAPESLINVFFVLVSGIYAFKTARILNIPEAESAFFSLFLVIGSNLIFLTVYGWVWFIAQTMSFALTLMAFYYAVTDNKAHSALSLFLLACAFGCRPFQILYTPLLLYLFCVRYKKETGKITSLFTHLTISAIPALALGVVYMALNYFRFDNPFEFGHNFLPEFVEAQHGQFSFEYFKHNLPLLFRLPKIENGSVVFPFYNGVAFWMVSPIFLAYLINLIINAITERRCHNSDWVIQAIIFITAALHLALICFHKTLGGWHFGNRYTVDALPAVFLGIAWLRTRRIKPLSALYTFLLLLGLILNVYGTIKILTN